MKLSTYVVNNTRLSVDMRAPLAEAQRLITADLVTRGIILTPIPGFGSYSGNKASGATDTGSGHVDFTAVKMTDKQAARCVTYLRRVGFLAYFRKASWWSSWLKRLRTPGWQRHIHCLLVDSVDLSPAARAQLAEWIAGGDGLVGTERDDGDRAVVGRSWAGYQAAIARAAAAAKAAGAAIARAARIKALQRAVGQVADGRWGPVTDNVLWATRNVRQGGAARFTQYSSPNRRMLQKAWGTTPDGVWGPKTAAANAAAVRRVQAALGVAADGVWGLVTDRVFRSLRAAAFRK